MPILSNFPTGGSGGGGGLALAAVSGITTQVASGKVYVKWTDPADLIVAESTLAAWGGTLLVRKAGSVPTSRRDGTVVLDSKTRDAYQENYFCDSGLTNGVTYYYKFFPYTTSKAFTISDECAFNATPTAQVEGIEDWVVTSMSASSEAGNGKMNIWWTDPADTIISDDVTLATWASTTVVVKEGDYPVSKDDPDAVFTFKSTSRNQYCSNYLTVTGLTNGTEYYVAFYPETTDGGINTDSSQRVTGTANYITISQKPRIIRPGSSSSASTGIFTYDGNVHAARFMYYTSDAMTIGGTTSAINPGTYETTFTPKDDYRWSDGTKDEIVVKWTIGKAEQDITLSTSTVTLNNLTPSTTVVVTKLGDGKVEATSSNTSIATVSVDDTTITINSVNKTSGTATITVRVEEGTYYLASDANLGRTPTEITVTAEFVPALNDCTWAQISEIAQSGQGANYWAVGDCKAVTLSGTVGSLSLSGTYYAFILGFNHNSSKEGNAIHFQFGKTAASGGIDICFVDSGYNSPKSSGTWFNMNNSQDNSGGWNSSRMRTVICPAFKSAMPSDLQAVLKTVTKYSDNTGGGSKTASYVTATSDEVFLLAEYEVFGSSRYANSAEQNYQAQYAYYSAGNSKVKYLHSSTGSTAGWWLRSVYAYLSSSFCFVAASGSASGFYAYYSFGFAPAFCV